MKKHLPIIFILFITTGMVLFASPSYAKNAQPKLNKKKATIYVGNSTTLKLKNAKKAKVKWSSSNKAVAAVSKKGTVTGKKPGKATITANIKAKKYTTKITAKITVKTTQLNTQSITLVQGKSHQLTVLNVQGKVIWSSSNPSVAAVNDSGLITGLQAGSATITAKVQSVTYSCAVTIVIPRLNTEAITLTTGNCYQLNLLNLSETVTWSSSNEAITTVNNTGLIAGVQKGSAIITAKTQSTTCFCKVSVVDALSYTDFNYIVPAENYNNYIDDYLNSDKLFYVYYDATTLSKGYVMENRGVSFGNTYNDVINAFGYNNNFMPVTDSDPYREKFLSAAYPKNYIEYNYKEYYLTYSKRFYFDENKNLVLIIWRCDL